MENVLASLASCSSIHVLLILKKKRQKVTSYSVEATAERREEPPRAFTKIHLKYIVKGKNITPEAVESAIKLSEEKYCSVGGMLQKAVPITSSFEILRET
jgi:putative redox protein